MKTTAKAQLLLALFAIQICGGCLQQQLCRDTLNQMQTVHEIQQQQVLDNLAMFVHNYNSFPYFSVVTQGTSQLTDMEALAVTNGFARVGKDFVYNTLGINPSASRATQGSWQINPINDSIKLEVMRCAYQKAVAPCLGLPLPGDCPGCQELFNQYYRPPLPMPSGGSESENNLQNPTPASPESVPGKKTAGNLPAPNGEDKGTQDDKIVGSRDKPGGSTTPSVTKRGIYEGMITDECIGESGCWFCWGCKEKIPKNCCLVGHYCDTYVWVPPRHQDELSKLTLLIIDIAYYDPPVSGQAPTGRVNFRGDPEMQEFQLRAPTQFPYTTLGQAQILQSQLPLSVGPVPNSQ